MSEIDKATQHQYEECEGVLSSEPKWTLPVMVASVLALTGIQVALASSVDQNRGHNYITSTEFNNGFDTLSRAKIISESPATEDSNASFRLEQTLPDGRKITITRPVFLGELAIHERGDIVIPSNLEIPQRNADDLSD